MTCPTEAEMLQQLEDYREEERLLAYGELGDALIFYGLEGVEIVTEDEYRDGK